MSSYFKAKKKKFTQDCICDQRKACKIYNYMYYLKHGINHIMYIINYSNMHD